MNATDDRYRETLLEPLRACATYKPALGQRGRQGVSLNGFKKLYGGDPLYKWVGLDSDFMYAAHKAAGGMTSVYRQLGTGCERLVRAIVQDELGLTGDQVQWSYQAVGENGKKRTLTLDVRIDFDHLPNTPTGNAVKIWVADAAKKLGFSTPQLQTLQGAVFEVRQGYKSQDAKRQNADIQSAMRARNDCYAFVMAVLSTQIGDTLLRRYQNSQILVLVGDLSGDTLVDTFAFMDQVIGYDLEAFFTRNSTAIRTEVEGILKKLLSAK